MFVILCALISMFSFDYSYMLARRGYFSSDNNEYWSLVEPLSYKNSFLIKECNQYTDTLLCRGYYVYCDNGVISRSFELNELYVSGIEKLYKKYLIEAENISIEDSMYIFPTDLGDLHCNVGIFGLNCGYSDKSISAATFEAELCNETIKD